MQRTPSNIWGNVTTFKDTENQRKHFSDFSVYVAVSGTQFASFSFHTAGTAIVLLSSSLSSFSFPPVTYTHFMYVPVSELFLCSLLTPFCPILVPVNIFSNVALFVVLNPPTLCSPCPAGPPEFPWFSLL